MNGLGSLRRLLAQKPAVERCELCAIILAEQHPHLVDPENRRLMCACDACALLFTGTGETRFRRVPRDIYNLSDLNFPEELWNSLAIPIGLVFFFRSTPSSKMMAIYPSPAGPTETVLDEDLWEEIVTENPRLRKLQPDVEALLINRVHGARDYLLAPIDECYKLTGLIRKHWRGFSGGSGACDQIAGFFDGLKRRSRPSPVKAHA